VVELLCCEVRFVAALPVVKQCVDVLEFQESEMRHQASHQISGWEEYQLSL
jgi:hypothetical protein